ncbi:MAG: hypothetical protein HUU04_11140 [Verrucomicrobiae bacterium]|nr:hypothetical protein [Verrucomicrobiae bacterium]
MPLAPDGAAMSGTAGLMARVTYGSGSRLTECLRRRIKDVDFERGQIMLRLAGAVFPFLAAWRL